MMTDILTTEDYELCSKLKAMRFSGMAEALEELFRDPNADLSPSGRRWGGWWMPNGICATARS